MSASVPPTDPSSITETVSSRAPGSDILRLSGVHVRIAGSHILQGIDCAVAEGGVTALLGRNGVGKTTTLKAVLGLVPSSGIDRARRRPDRRAADASDRAVRRRLRAGGPRGVRLADGGGEPAARRGSGCPSGLRHSARAVPGAVGAAQATGRHAVRWATADGGPGQGVARPRRSCCWSTSRRKVSRRNWSRRSVTSWQGSRSGPPCCWWSRACRWSAGSPPPPSSSTTGGWCHASDAASLLADEHLVNALLGVAAGTTEHDPRGGGQRS